MSATIQNLPEIKIVINAADLIPAQLELDRNELIQNADAIKTVTSSDDNQVAGECVVGMRKHVKATTASRLAITRRFDDAKKLVMDFFEKHNAPLDAEIIRIQNLGKNYLEMENRRVAEEEEKRRKEFEAAQQAQFALDEAARKAAEYGSLTQQMIANRKLESAKITVQEIINEPEPVAIKAKGQTMKQVLKWEVTDLMELVKHNPQLCKIEPKASAINSTCHPNLNIPGLRCWFENQSTYTTR